MGTAPPGGTGQGSQWGRIGKFESGRGREGRGRAARTGAGRGTGQEGSAPAAAGGLHGTTGACGRLAAGWGGVWDGNSPARRHRTGFAVGEDREIRVGEGQGPPRAPAPAPGSGNSSRGRGRGWTAAGRSLPHVRSRPLCPYLPPFAPGLQAQDMAAYVPNAGSRRGRRVGKRDGRGRRTP